MSAAQTPARTQALRGHAAMLIFSASISGSFSLGAMVANDITPTALTAARFLLATILLAIMVQVLPGLGRGRRRGFSRADIAAPWRYGVLALLYAGYFVLMFEGLKTAPPVAAGAVFTLTPLMTALIAWPLIGQRPVPYVGGALVLGALGALWVIFRGDLQAALRLDVGQGEAIYFIGCVLHAVYAPMMKRLNRGESAAVTSALLCLAGFVVLLVYGWREIAATPWLSLSPLVWVTAVYLAVFATALSTAMLQFAAQRIPSSKVMAYSYVTPESIIGWELALGHGGPGAVVMPGIVLILGALALLLRAD